MSCKGEAPVEAWDHSPNEHEEGEQVRLVERRPEDYEDATLAPAPSATEPSTRTASRAGSVTDTEATGDGTTEHDRVQDRRRPLAHVPE